MYHIKVFTSSASHRDPQWCSQTCGASKCFESHVRCRCSGFWGQGRTKMAENGLVQRWKGELLFKKILLINSQKWPKTGFFFFFAKTSFWPFCPSCYEFIMVGGRYVSEFWSDVILFCKCVLFLGTHWGDWTQIFYLDWNFSTTCCLD